MKKKQSWKCWFRKHDWQPLTYPRLLVLTDDPWPTYTDGLPPGKRLDCTRCGARSVELFAGTVYREPRRG